MSFPSYESYSPSGIEWQLEVPSHWEAGSLRWLATIYSGGTPDKKNEDYWEDGTVPWLNSGAVNQQLVTEPSTYITEDALENSSAKWVPKDALVIALAGQGKTKGMVAQLAFRTTCNQSMAAITPNSNLDARFLFWWLTSNYQNIRNLSGGNLRDGLNLQLLGTIGCPIPSEDEQKAISSFLDVETSKIDGLVSEQRRLIELLKEKRQAVISHAVTKGLNPNAPMKPSGIVGFGKVPDYWELSKLGWLLRESPKNGTSPQINVDGQTPTFSIAAVKKGTTDIRSHLKYADISTDDAQAFLVQKDDILVLRGNGNKALVGTAGIVADEPPENCIYPDILIRIRPSKQITSWYLVTALNSSAMRPTVEMAAQTASGVWKISGKSLRDLRIAVPPPEMQKEIERECRKQVETFSQLQLEAERAIALLQERRTALISAAVTGKIDVRKIVYQVTT